MMTGDPAVVLLSGGLDSTTVLAIARAEGYVPYALSFRYGQRHSVELEAAPGSRTHSASRSTWWLISTCGCSAGRR